MLLSDLCARGYLALNSLLILLSFVPWFGGTAEAPGVADKLFGRSGGFRVDFLWLIVAFGLTSVWTVYNAISSRNQRSRRMNAVLGACWCVGFLIYVGHALLSGVLDFG